MSDRVLFHMWGPFRASLIKGHLFYVEQARKRLLSQFNDIESEADRAAEEWLQQSAQLIDHERDDLVGLYETAEDVGIEHYELLSGMQEQTRLSVVAGMFHEWEKQLKDWLVREIQHWHHGSAATQTIWSAKFEQLIEFMECIGYKNSPQQDAVSLDACRLIVNVFKHGEGKSFTALRDKYPRYIRSPFHGVGETDAFLHFLNFTNLFVSDNDIDDFACAIQQFWNGVPERVMASDLTKLPDWFLNAVEKDRASKRQTGGE